MNHDCNGNNISLGGTTTAHPIVVLPAVPVAHKFKDRGDGNKAAGHFKYSIFIYATCPSVSPRPPTDKRSLLTSSSHPLYPVAQKSRAGERSEAREAARKDAQDDTSSRVTSTAEELQSGLVISSFSHM